MHYIPGYKFTTSGSIRSTHFSKSTEYTIYNIKAVIGGFDYTFKFKPIVGKLPISAPNLKLIHFDYTADADKAIAEVTGEKLPNYEVLAAKRSD